VQGVVEERKRVAEKGFFVPGIFELSGCFL